MPESLLLYNFPDFVLPVSQYIVSIVAAVSGHINQMQMKTKASSTAMKVERKLSFYQKALLNATFR